MIFFYDDGSIEALTFNHCLGCSENKTFMEIFIIYPLQNSVGKCMMSVGNGKLPTHINCMIFRLLYLKVRVNANFANSVFFILLYDDVLDEFVLMDVGIGDGGAFDGDILEAYVLDDVVGIETEEFNLLSFDVAHFDVLETDVADVTTLFCCAPHELVDPQ